MDDAKKKVFGVVTPTPLLACFYVKAENAEEALEIVKSLGFVDVYPETDNDAVLGLSLEPLTDLLNAVSSPYEVEDYVEEEDPCGCSCEACTDCEDLTSDDLKKRREKVDKSTLN